MVRIRLQRHGKKRRPFYYLVVADQKAKRDGRFIEKIGTYNPVMQPQEINVNIERATYWLEVGAQPSETARILLSKSGALMKNHLNGGVKKGAFSQEEAEKKFSAWMSDKEKKDISKLALVKKTKETSLNQRLEEEKKKAELIEKTKMKEAEEKAKLEVSQEKEIITENQETEILPEVPKED